MVQLPHVSRPGMVQEQLQGCRIEARDLLAVAPDMLPEEEGGQRRNILAAVPEGGHAHLDGIETE